MAKPGIIYFVRPGNSRFVKIGWTGDYSARLNALRTNNPEPINLLRAIEGTMADEKSLHTMFARHRVHGEWYELVPRILAFIESSQRDHVEPDTAEMRRTIKRMEAYSAVLDGEECNV